MYSKKDPNFKSKVKKIYVITKGAESSKNFLKEVTGFLRNELYKQGVTSEGYFYDRISLDSDNEIKDRIKKYNPELVFTITQTEIKTAKRRDSFGISYDYEAGADLDLKLLLPESDKPVWRSSLVVEGNFGVGTTTMKVVKEIIAKWKIDGIID